MRGAELIQCSWAKNARQSRWLAAGLALGFVLCGLLGGVAQAQDPPYKGVVTENRLKVRSGGSSAYYAVGTIKKGQMVTVNELYHGWYKIKPPKGVHSYISKAFVNRQGDGSQGVINRNRAEVKAASLRGPGFSYRGQTDLDRGRTVRIVSEEGGYYKIMPPKGVYVYLKPGSVRKATQKELAKVRKQNGGNGSKAEGGKSENDSGQAKSNSQTNENQSSTRTEETKADNGQSGDTPRTNNQSPKKQPQTKDQTASRGSSATAGGPAKQSNPPDQGKESRTQGKQRQPNPSKQTEQTSTEQSPPAMSDANASANPGETGGNSSPSANAVQSTAKASNGPSSGKTSSPNADKANNPNKTNAHTSDIRNLPIAESDGLAAVDKKLKPLFNRPVQQQPIDSMISAYSQFEGDQQLSQQDQRLVKIRLAALRHNKKVRQALDQADQALSQNPATPPKPEIDLSRMSPGDFDAVGILRPSSVYNGRNLPRRLRLVDTSTKRTNAYINPSKQINAKKMMGKLVGVLGTRDYDPATKLTVIHVDRIAVLSPEKKDKGQSQTKPRGKNETTNAKP